MSVEFHVTDEQRAADESELAERLKRKVAEAPPPVGGVLKFFAFAHLPPHLRAMSAAYTVLAISLVNTAPSSPELTVALRKLLESKDAAVRALLP